MKGKNTMKKLITLIALLLTVATLLISCNSGTVTESTSELETNENEQIKLDTEKEIKVSVLNGSTGFGIAKLMSDKKAGNAALNYKFTVETDASNITAALINGTVDIAALPTNAASVVYNKTQGKVKIAAINTLGVLYVMANSEKVTVNSLADLNGKTVYTPAQNPTFIFKYICEANDIDVTVDNSFAQPADLRAALVSGQVDIAVLPEPMVTIAKSANNKLSTVLDLTAEWDKVSEAGSLAQGCIVVRTAFAEQNPNELAKFLEEYKASVKFTNEKPNEASAMIESEGIFAKAAVAKNAIPKCNIVYIDGDEMAARLDKFFEILGGVAPASIGGKAPDANIYYKGK